MRFIIPVLILGTAITASSRRVTAQGPGAYRPPPPPDQPIPFSHKQHATVVPTCTDCHKAATSDVRAGIPRAAQCVMCHKQPTTPALKALTDYAAAGEVPWRRVIRVPDYVIFSHKTHMAIRDTTCEDCHGKVQEMMATQKVLDMSMAACIECHKQRNAPDRCDACHEPIG
jgi:predicted CXXCH cytochrome family protein